MAKKERPKKLFKVASEFNVSTSSIVDTLAENDFEIDNKPNSKVTPEMYTVLEESYGMDKQRSKEHEKAREQYESRRSEMHENRNERVSVESFLEPIDEEEDEEDLPLAPEETEEAEETEEYQEEEAAEETEQEEAEEVSSDEEQQETDDQEAESEEPVEQEEADQSVDTKEETDTEKEEAVVEETAESEETPVDEEEPPEVTEEKPDQEEKIAPQSEEAKADELQAEEEEPEKADTEKNEEPELEAEAESGDQKKLEEKDSEEKETETESTEADSAKNRDTVIRGRAERLEGPKVVGKVRIGDDDDSDKKRKKRKKRKKKKTKSRKDDSDKGRSKKRKKRKKRKKKSIDSDKKSKKKKQKKKRKKRKKRGKRFDEQDVEEKMKETMQRMQQSEGVGRKRQKRRRQKREEREEERKQQEELEELEKGILEVTEFITVNDLADHLNVDVNDVITTCMNLGMMVSINQRLDASTIELVAEEYGKEVEFIDADDMMDELEMEDEDKPAEVDPRAPVITVMGHVDHGKTSLLDYVRKTKVVAGEAGGITQHVGAYEIEREGRNITFLDTPGHQAFTAMRSRGAHATDIVILVVAADDAVKPQTIEAINHAKAAGVPIVVAINKVDKEEANPDKIKQQLAEHDVLVEEYGGDHQFSHVSAKTGEGIDDLLDKLLIQAELMELKANPERRAEGIVLESFVDKGKGITANVLIENGTLETGDPFVAGSCFGRVRAMEDERGNHIENAGPSKPIQLIGFDDQPQAGDRLIAMEDEQTAKEVASQRQQIRREHDLRKSKHVSLDDLSRQLALGEVSELNVIIKADVSGSVEALSDALQQLDTDEVKVNIIHTGVGAIVESDVLLASASDAIIIGFQVRPTTNARKLAKEEEIDVRLFSVIYDAVEEVKDALEGMLEPHIRENIIGHVEVRETFKVPDVGMVAGCYVQDGKIKQDSNVRLIRDGIVIYDGEIGSLKRFQDDVKEVKSGYECGLNIQKYNDVKEGDEIEVYETIEEKRKLDAVSDDQ